MKRPENQWPVTATSGPRPAGKPDECFYCHLKIGEQHKPDCVMRSRTVLVEARVQYVVKVPEDWTERDILFHRNDSSWCSDNGLKEIAAVAEHMDKTGQCLDIHFGEERMTYAFVREATKDDEDFYGVKIVEEESE